MRGLTRRNMLLGVDVDGTWVKESRRAKEFFEERFKEMPLERPGLEGVELQKINEEDNNFFISNYEEYEVKQCGINFHFIKKFWSIVKRDVMKFVEEFHVHGVLPRGTNLSFITLVASWTNYT